MRGRENEREGERGREAEREREAENERERGTEREREGGIEREREREMRTICNKNRGREINRNIDQQNITNYAPISFKFIF